MQQQHKHRFVGKHANKGLPVKNSTKKSTSEEKLDK